MPLYDYKCTACGHVTEIRHGFGESHGQTCEVCGGQLARVFNPAPIVFKGSGFYVTDSRAKAAGNGSKSDAKSDVKSDVSSGSGSDAPASESSKTDPKASDAKPGDQKSVDAKSTNSKPAGTKPGESAA